MFRMTEACCISRGGGGGLYFCNRVTTLIVDSIHSKDEFLISHI